MPTIKQLPGRLKAFFGMKGIFARSLGYSRKFNPRNLEFMWYPLWGHAIHETFRDMENVLVAHQFPIWLDPSEWPDLTNLGEDEHQERPEDSAGPSAHAERVIRTKIPFGTKEDAVGGPSPSESISFLSKGITAPLRNASSQIIDTAVLVVEAIPVEDSIRRYGGYRVSELWVPIIIEIKKCLRRHYTAEEMEAQTSGHVATMEAQIYTQAAYVFAKFRRMQELVAIAGVGDYWCHATIRRRADLSESQLNDIRRGRSTTGYKSVHETVKADHWSTPIPLDSQESDERFSLLKTYVKTFIATHEGFPGTGPEFGADDLDSIARECHVHSGNSSPQSDASNAVHEVGGNIPNKAKKGKSRRRGKTIKTTLTEAVRSSVRLREKISQENAEASSSGPAGSSTVNVASSEQAHVGKQKGKKRDGKKTTRGRK
ncbi:hypothetical protein CERSUDRAFT_73989 [Gelatoporia subvermispora B]|uniref:Uncharacterized protein n=1 Tax=Ceriporiopsis subvermispora (strain B) TaxID=914234 RepID=M2REW1_CERS8|nr:hypothetical protein CERSUDRAFT_73989 [Gelatoporia subvermispora B]